MRRSGAYLGGWRVLLRLTSEATYPRGLNSLEGICPCLGSRARAHGAHLATQVERIEQSSTVLAAPPTFLFFALSLVARRLAAWARVRYSYSMIEKSQLRSEMRARRKRLAELDPDAASRLAAHAERLPGGKVVAVYRAIGSEMDTAALSRALSLRGMALCLPVVTARDAPMEFRLWMIGDPLEPDAAGVPAPLPLSSAVDPDRVLTPLLAFDARGARLGQGGGYYDRTFAVLSDAMRVGFAYAGQEVEPLTLESHDIRLHGVLTETGYRAAV